MWMNLKTSDVWQNWSMSLAAGLTMKSGLLDNSPLLNFLENVFDDTADYKKRVTIAAADVDTGDVHVFDQTNTTFKDLAQAAFSSASIPFIFPPYKWEGVGIFMDGGTNNVGYVQNAIEQCKDVVGGDESKITVDVYVCTDLSWESEPEDKSGKTLSNYTRARSIGSSIKHENGISLDMESHPDVNFRYLVYETIDHLGGISELEFSGEKTWPL